MFGEDIKFARAGAAGGLDGRLRSASQVLHSHEYDATTVYRRTYVDAELNMKLLQRPCIDSFRDALIMTGRSWKADRAALRSAALPAVQRLKWGAFSRSTTSWSSTASGAAGATRGARAGATRSACPCPSARSRSCSSCTASRPTAGPVSRCSRSRSPARLRERGHDVSLFVRSPGKPDEADRSLHESEFDGFKVWRYVNRLRFSGVDETYRFGPAEAAFDRVLAQVKPDVVHVQHMIHLSTGIIDRCRAAGVACVVTLSDFWARCSRVQLIRPNHKNCRIPPPGLGCAACVKEKPQLIDALATVDRLLGPLPARWAARVPQSIPAFPPGWRRPRKTRRASCGASTGCARSCCARTASWCPRPR
jgi:hypothetical protein